MSHFPLLMIVPQQIYHRGVIAIYNYVDLLMEPHTHHICDRYVIGGMWEYCLKTPQTQEEWVYIQMEITSNLAYNLVRVDQLLSRFKKGFQLQSKVIDLTGKITEQTILAEHLEHYVVIIDCHRL